MRRPSIAICCRFTPLLATLLTLSLVAIAGAQSQEPKPSASATPVSETETSPVATPVTGVSGSTWVGPNWGVTIAWDSAAWTVEGELIDAGYDGLQLGTPSSTVYVEAYDGYAGDAEACLADAESEIRAREGVTEVEGLAGRQLPNIDAERWPTQLFGLIAELPDGSPYRGVELSQCRTLVPGSAVLELTWQTAANAYNQELPLVDALFATLSVPNEATPEPLPVPAATPTLAKPAHSSVQLAASFPERANAK
jgi:hypothetical protein